MPRVALFSINFLPYSQTFVYEEIRNHVRYEVEVFAGRRLFAERFPFEPVHVGGLPYYATSIAPSFDRAFRRRRFDVVHAHFGTGGIHATPYARRYHLPLVVTFHGIDVAVLHGMAKFLPHRLPYAILWPLVLRRMTLGLCASNELREMLIEIGAPADRLVLHRLGIDLAAFAPGERDATLTRVVMIGRHVGKKGFEYGLRAFARVAATGASASLTIVGTGPRRRALEELARALGVADRVTFTGELPSARVAEVLRASDVLMAPSVVGRDGDRESGVIAIKEASASEVVPLATWHGGIPEIVEDGVTGFLVPERNVEALADRLARLVADRVLRRTMGRAARAKMEREYDNRQRVVELEQRYDEARERYAREGR